ncbi:MAG TPA: PEGA domain-containing protein [Gemmataceae bacterium]|nr:PEGA domain-containing protein [Gemmataceae bacterium]
MKRIACLATLMTMTWTAGCVERRLTIYSEPTGALVYHNGNYLGPTPVDRYFVYYGKQQFRLIKEGYETRDIVQDISPPWYEWPGIDFLTENIWPFKVRDVRRFSYAMRPLRSIPPEEVRQRAEELRARGQIIGVPPAPRPIAPAPAAPLPPPTPPPPQNTLPAPRPVAP